MGGGDVVTWTFDITDDGFDPLTQDVTSASIRLNLSDDSGWDFWEFATLNIGTNHFSWEVGDGDAAFRLASLMTLSDTGRVEASLSAVWGDFYFNSATLTAEGTLATGETPPPAPVPECASIFLLGAGLVGLTAVTRRKLNIAK